MDERIAAIRQELVGTQQDLSALLDHVTDDGWMRVSPNEGWTIRDLLTHLITENDRGQRAWPAQGRRQAQLFDGQSAA